MHACAWQIMLLVVTELKIQVADGAWMVRLQQLANYNACQILWDDEIMSRFERYVTHKTARFVAVTDCQADGSLVLYAATCIVSHYIIASDLQCT